jgi:DNA-binding IclR family transcriptional regulator
MVSKNDLVAPQQRAGRYTIEAVANALSILGAIAGREVLSLGAASEIAEVSKSTAYRLLATLESAGLVEKLPGGGYRAGAEAVRWASQLLAQLDIRTVARPLLRQLRGMTGETVNLAILREDSLVYVEVFESPAAFRMADVPGATAPIHGTALGKAVAIHLDPAHLGRLLGPEPYPQLTPSTATTWLELNARLEETRARGYAVDLEEAAIGVVCIAAPVLVRGHVVGAVSVSAPQARMAIDRVAEVGTMLLDTTERIALRLP